MRLNACAKLRVVTVVRLQRQGGTGDRRRRWDRFGDRPSAGGGRRPRRDRRPRRRPGSGVGGRARRIVDGVTVDISDEADVDQCATVDRRSLRRDRPARPQRRHSRIARAVRGALGRRLRSRDRRQPARHVPRAAQRLPSVRGAGLGRGDRDHRLDLQPARQRRSRAVPRLEARRARADAQRRRARRRARHPRQRRGSRHRAHRPRRRQSGGRRRRHAARPHRSSTAAGNDRRDRRPDHVPAVRQRRLPDRRDGVDRRWGDGDEPGPPQRPAGGASGRLGNLDEHTNQLVCSV